MHIKEFFVKNWKTVLVTVVATLVAYHIYYKGKGEAERKEERGFREEVKGRLIRLETKKDGIEKRIDTLYTLYPQLKDLEKLDDFKKLNLTPDDIRKIVSEVLEATNITPEAIDVSIDERIEKRFGEFDIAIARMIAQKLDEIDNRFKKPVGSASAYLILGNIQFYKGNYPKAIESYNAAIQIKPDYSDAWYGKGAALGRLGRHDEALKALDKAIELKPDFAEIWCNKGIVLVELGRCDEALNAHEKAIELKPNLAEAWYGKGVALARLGRHDETLKVFEKALELKSDNAEAWWGKGTELARLGRHDEALKAYEKAIELKPNLAEVWYGKGLVLGELGRPDEALKALEKAIELKPNLAEVWYGKGLVLGELGRHDGALKAHEKAIELKPDFAETLYNLASVYSLKGDKENALRNLSEAIELDLKYKKDAKENKVFKKLWDDDDFKKLVQ